MYKNKKIKYKRYNIKESQPLIESALYSDNLSLILSPKGQVKHNKSYTYLERGLKKTKNDLRLLVNRKRSFNQKHGISINSFMSKIVML